jgi:zinc transport system substrate-binding protein
VRRVSFLPPVSWKLLFVVLIIFGPSGCHGARGPKIKVTTSIFPVYDLTRRIAGPDADVIMLEPVEASAHQYSPGPADMDRATGTKLAIMIGLDLDAWMQPMMTRVSPKARILRLADRVPTLPRQLGLNDETKQAKRDAARRGQPDEESRPPNEVDAHVWLDPQRAILMARAIGEELCRVDPGNAKGYRARALAVTQSLDVLDHETEDRTAQWKQRTFVTLHDAFRYYAARYHLEVAAAAEPTPGIRPSIRYDQTVLRRLHERNAGGIFGEPQLDSQTAKTLAQAANLPYGVLDPLGGTAGVDSYEALIRFDTEALGEALSAPAAAPSQPPSPTPAPAPSDPSP